MKPKLRKPRDPWWTCERGRIVPGATGLHLFVRVDQVCPVHAADMEAQGLWARAWRMRRGDTIHALRFMESGSMFERVCMVSTN